jgi:hypothetical protein
MALESELALRSLETNSTSTEHSNERTDKPLSAVHLQPISVSGTKLEQSSHIYGSTYIRTELFWRQHSAMTEQTAFFKAKLAGNANVRGLSTGTCTKQDDMKQDISFYTFPEMA